MLKLFSGAVVFLCFSQLIHARKSRTSLERRPTFLQVATSVGTDKVTVHNYDAMYTKYFEGLRLRRTVRKILEIGLGCTMAYGPGASAKLWRKYLPRAQVWEADFDAACVSHHSAALDSLGVHILVGDQSNTAHLHQWINSSGGNFDIIVDDGGHTNMQQYNAFVTLFVHALNPGGIYFLEDLVVSRTWVDGDKKHVMADVIRDWVENLMLGEATYPQLPLFAYNPWFKLPPGVKSIECFLGCCAFTKCTRDDARCLHKGVDVNLTKYADTGTALLTGG